MRLGVGWGPSLKGIGLDAVPHAPLVGREWLEARVQSRLPEVERAEPIASGEPFHQLSGGGVRAHDVAGRAIGCGTGGRAAPPTCQPPPGSPQAPAAPPPGPPRPPR